MRLLRKRRQGGFTLLELIISLSLSAFVLVGIIQVSATMVRYQLNAGLKGSAGGGTIIALGRMSRQLEDATYLANPATTYPTGTDFVSGCTNWSQLGNRRINSTAPPLAPCTGGAGSNVMSFVYCQKPSDNSLWVHYNCGATCNIPIVNNANCGTAVGTAQIVVGGKPGFYKHASYANIFYRVRGGVDMHYVVGQSTPTVAEPTPAFYRMDQRVLMNKSVNNTD